MFGIVLFVQTKLPNFNHVFWVCKFPTKKYQWVCKKIHYCSIRSPSWLYKESVTTLGGVRHCFVSNPSWLWEESITCGDWLLLLLAIFHPDGLLSEPWRTPRRAMTDYSQSHGRLMVEQWQISKLENKVKIKFKYILAKTIIPKILSVNCTPK